MAQGKAPETVVRRIPRYYRYLEDLFLMGRDRVSSQELAGRMGLTASQIRQDLNCFGGFGQQGYGYNVAELRRELARILGLGELYRLIIIGAGNIGQALANYHGFDKDGFEVLAAFDSAPDRVGTRLSGGVMVHAMNDLEAFLAQNHTDVAVVATPRDSAQDVADRLFAAGVHFVWNFAPADVTAPEGCHVENVQLTDSLLMLSYRARGFGRARE